MICFRCGKLQATSTMPPMPLCECSAEEIDAWLSGPLESSAQAEPTSSIQNHGIAPSSLSDAGTGPPESLVNEDA